MTQTDPVSPAQIRAAHAYASVLLEAEVASAAADDAVAAFRETLGAGSGSAAPGATETLLALTRLMTAVSLPDRSSPEDRRQAVWASIGSASHCTCREASALLATRANGNIQPRESTALDEHLATCAECRELSVRAVAADAAFRRALAPPSGGLGGGLPGGPRTGAALLAVLIALAAGIYALSSGGSNSSRASAAPAPAHTQTSEAVALTVPAVPRPATPHHRSVHHATRAKPATRHMSRHPRTVTQPAPTATAATTTSNAVGAGTAATPAATSSDTAGAVTTPSVVSTPAPSSHTATHAAPSTAAQVSGPSSLPADSAPQQGIGSLTSTTP